MHRTSQKSVNYAIFGILQRKDAPETAAIIFYLQQILTPCAMDALMVGHFHVLAGAQCLF